MTQANLYRLRLRRAEALVALILGGLSTGCSEEPAISGQVQDIFERPVDGAIVTIEGSQFRAKTDASGKYTIPFAPGQILLRAEAADSQPSTLALTISQKTKYPASTITLYPTLPKGGVYLLDLQNNKIVPAGKAKPEIFEYPISQYSSLVAFESTSPAQDVTVKLLKNQNQITVINTADPNLQAHYSGEVPVEKLRKMAPTMEGLIGAVKVMRRDFAISELVHTNELPTEKILLKTPEMTISTFDVRSRRISEVYWFIARSRIGDHRIPAADESIHTARVLP